ncbi:pentapeptide repeat-containing protein [Nocardia sp. SYP-A9097]|uniref:pentapeptide repeat-containing protein n=1 Tax=Nocardia sp. SYP-A9097 TaxID=2663237 RepID=UPI0035C8CA67
MRKSARREKTCSSGSIWRCIPALPETHLEDIDFSAARFSGAVRFERAIFSGAAVFEDATARS